MATTQVWSGMPLCASRNSDVYMGVTASAPAKVILFGEHFVVYGEPAMVVAIDKRAYAKVELRQDKRLYLHSVNLNLAGYFENGYFQVEQGGAKEAKLKFKPLKLADVVMILALHVDYEKYIQFQEKVPVVLLTLGGKPIIQEIGELEYTRENALFCFNFVLDCIIRWRL